MLPGMDGMELCKHLREKLGPAAGLVKSVRGIGYKLNA